MAKAKKRAVPSEHWEKGYDPCVYRNTRTEMGEQFNPKKPTDRMTTYVKTNEQDH